ncbi:hypothetical protein ACP70R_019798 [Stipagrostis hirtigluma subsp. patula]
MHPSALLLIVAAAVGAAMVHGHPADSTPAALFWSQALPGIPMPGAIADLIQKGIDHSPLVEHYSASPSISVCTFANTICPKSMVAETGIFFHEEQLRPGSTMTVSLPAEAEAAILPHDVAEKVPFWNLEDVLATFGIPAGSAEADQVRDTLRRCQAPPHAGEQRSCTTSLESTVQSAMRMLGASTPNGGGMWAGTSVLPSGGLPRQTYVVEAAARLVGKRYVACHLASFPYAVYQCHMPKEGYLAYALSLRGLREGQKATMLAYCHLDTSDWNPAHPAFEILQTHPGGSRVCHLIPHGNLVFIQKTADKAS